MIDARAICWRRSAPRCSAARCCRSLVLKFKRGRRQKKFGAQFPDALDIIVRSLRAGHPVPIAITMVAREMADPIGSEFGIVADEITYGADLETGMRNLYFRIGQDDLPLFVTAVAIQSSTGGNLGEILENLSAVIRERFKMRRKIRALASEGRASAMILSSLPILMFLVIQVITPEFYASVWHEDLTKICLAAAGGWMADRQLHHVPHGQLQDLSDGHARTAAERRQQHPGRRCWCSSPPATLAFCVMAVMRVQGSVKRRAANIGRIGDIGRLGGNRSLRHSSMKAAQRVIEYTTKHYPSGNTEETKVLRRRMIQAGIYDPRAVAYFFLGRTVLAVGLAALRVLLRAGGAGRPGVLAADRRSAASSAISGRASTSTSASRRARPSTSPAFRISWICWWCAPTPASAWRRRSTASAASSANPIRRSPPTST